VKLENLTPRQREVIEAREPVVLVLGGPGTGKTTVALWAARVALRRENVAEWQRVLFLTFSRTAVGQIAKRTPGVFGSGGGTRIEIATFHGFAWRLLRAFGRYAGRGAAPVLQSGARTKILGPDTTRLVYADLLPAAAELLRSTRLRSLLARRWPLVICDEFQDTDDEQWALLRMLAADAQLLLLADPNQMIYSFLKARGVSPERLNEARSLAGREVELEAHSHRDPTGAIPAMADAVRRRDFRAEAVSHAVRTDRLTIVPDVPDAALPKIIESIVAQSRAAGLRSVGVFGHSNEGVATLGAALSEVGLDHVLVGIPEAHAEALTALATLCARSIGLATSSDVRLAFATFLTACTRSREAPPLAVQLARGGALPGQLERRLIALEEALSTARDGTVGELVTIAAKGWEAIGITSGARPWRRACLDFSGLARQLASLGVSEERIRALVAAAERRRPGILVEFDATRLGPVQLMNFHQTKGREADVVLLVYRDGDYLTDRRDREPFEEASRVLFVALTRARQRVVVVLPSAPHPLVAPFVHLAAAKG